MRGSIRRRGKHSYEYIVDIGTASAQRCQVCGRASGSSASRGSAARNAAASLLETEERRRAIKGGFATTPGVRGRPQQGAGGRRGPHLHATHQDHGEGLPAERVAAGRQRHACARRPTQATRCSPSEHIIPRLGGLQLQKLSPARSTPSMPTCSEHGRVHGGGPLSASSVRRVHAVLHRACHDAVRWGQSHASTRLRAPIRPRQVPSITTGCRCGPPSSSVPSSITSQKTASTRSGDCWP